MYKLEEIPFFANLPKPYLNMLRDKVFIKHYKKNSIVFFEGDRSRYMYIVLEGSVKMYKTTPKGTQVHINILKAPSLIGEYVYFEDQPFPATCEFVNDGVIGLIPFEIVEDLLTHKDFAKSIISSLTGKIALLSALVHQETILSSEAKVADIILNKEMIFQRLKNSEIASILNLTPETFSRIISKFKKEGIITLNAHTIDILDREKLVNIIDTNKVKECTDCIANFKSQIGFKD